MGRPVGKTAQQVALRWLLQKGAAYTVHSSSAAHLTADLDVFDFSLTHAQMERLDALAGGLLA